MNRLSILIGLFLMISCSIKENKNSDKQELRLEQKQETKVNSNEPEEILEIRKNFKTWQPIIDKKVNTDTKYLYEYFWGDQYQHSKWYNQKFDTDTMFIFNAGTIIENNELGYYVTGSSSSPSGDWVIKWDYYYNLNKKLYFIFWTMNTFQSETEAVTVEKRLYFDRSSNEIRNLSSVYKMNTKEKSNSSFYDRDVVIKKNLEDLDIYKAWKLMNE